MKEINKESTQRSLGITAREVEVLSNMLERDKSYQGRGFWSHMSRYSFGDVRNAYFNGLTKGFHEGKQFTTNSSTMLHLSHSANTENEKQFYESFLELCDKHNLGIHFDPLNGMGFRKLNPQNLDVIPNAEKRHSS
jgi:hypothetical protein